jgi:NhaP-type Na+/H+ or K+/H+ antiporter
MTWALPAMRREYAVPVRLLGIGLPLTIVAGALAGAAVLPGITFTEAVVLACTDAASARRSSPTSVSHPGSAKG